MVWFYCSPPHHRTAALPCHCVLNCSKSQGQAGREPSIQSTGRDSGCLAAHFKARNGNIWATSCSFRSPRVAGSNSLYKKSINSHLFLKRQPPPTPRGTKTEQQFKHHISIGSYKWLFNCYSMFMGIKGDEAVHFIMGLPTQNICL